MKDRNEKFLYTVLYMSGAKENLVYSYNDEPKESSLRPATFTSLAEADKLAKHLSIHVGCTYRIVKYNNNNGSTVVREYLDGKRIK